MLGLEQIKKAIEITYESAAVIHAERFVPLNDTLGREEIPPASAS